jgi:DNA-binding XRE family transcriptional regulator
VRSYDINGDWLATGSGEMQGGSPILWEVEFSIETHGIRLFSEVYDSAPDVFKPHKPIAFSKLINPPPGFNPERHLERQVAFWFRMARFRSSTDAARFARSVEDFGVSLLKEFRRHGSATRIRLSKLIEDHKAARSFQHRELLKCQQRVDKDILDTKSGNSIVAGVSSVPTWPQLRKLIIQQTSARGAKASLAKKLHVSRQVLNNWLSSREQGAPNAELTLELLQMFWTPSTK